MQNIDNLSGPQNCSLSTSFRKDRNLNNNSKLNSLCIQLSWYKPSTGKECTESGGIPVPVKEKQPLAVWTNKKEEHLQIQKKKPKKPKSSKIVLFWANAEIPHIAADLIYFPAIWLSDNFCKDILKTLFHAKFTFLVV